MKVCCPVSPLHWVVRPAIHNNESLLSYQPIQGKTDNTHTCYLLTMVTVLLQVMGELIDNWETFTIWHLNQLPTKFIKIRTLTTQKVWEIYKRCTSQKLIFLYVPHPHPISLLLDWLTKTIPQFLCSYGGIEFTIYVIFLSVAALKFCFSSI